jgi:hypothetical protein
VAPIAATLGAPLASVTNFAAYECRGRNRVVGALISEHGKGNALDIRALTLANGKQYEPTDVAVSKGRARTAEGERLRRASALCSARPPTDITRTMSTLISRNAAAATASANGPCATPPS